MKLQNVLVVAALVGLGLVGCGGGTASGPTTTSRVGELPAADQPGLASGPLALDVWYVVRGSDTRALPVGSGLRMRATGYDVSSGGQGQTMAGPCTLAEGAVDCDVSGATLRVSAREDGTLEATQGPLVLTLGPASASDSQTFDATVTAHDAQTSACSAAASCCIAAEESLGLACDLNATLGDRSASSCEAALARLRETLAPHGSAAPAACR